MTSDCSFYYSAHPHPKILSYNINYFSPSFYVNL